jgi:hypothetical protein
MLFTEIIYVHTENHMKPINTSVGKMQSYWVLKQAVHIAMIEF